MVRDTRQPHGSEDVVQLAPLVGAAQLSQLLPRLCRRDAGESGQGGGQTGGRVGCGVGWVGVCGVRDGGVRDVCVCVCVVVVVVVVGGGGGQASNNTYA